MNQSVSQLALPLPVSTKLFSSTQPFNEEMLKPSLDLTLFSKKELKQLNNEMQRTNLIMKMETSLFESFGRRIQAQRVNSGKEKSAEVDDTTRDGGPSQTQHIPIGNQNNRRDKKKRTEKSREVEKVAILTLEQKAEIASKEQEELRDEIERIGKGWEKDADNIKAEMEEIELRMSDTKKASYEFKRDIVQQAVNSRTGKVIAEKILRYFEEKIRSKDAVIEKTRLKNASLKVQRAKLLVQLKQKEEMGEVLHAIDFDQLTIENAQYQGKIEEKNIELFNLKNIVADTVQSLNSLKQKLIELNDESEKLKIEINQRKETFSKMHHETNYVSDEYKKVYQANLRIKRRMENFRVPEIMDYVGIKTKEQDLIVAVKSWRRKVEIQEMAARIQRRNKHD